jgi:hypothetical protein
MTFRFDSINRDTANKSAEQIQRGMYGMTEAQLDRQIQSQSFTGLELMYAAGLLSDCQEILSHSDCDEEDEIRKYLNQAKYIIFNYMEKHNIR